DYSVFPSVIFMVCFIFQPVCFCKKQQKGPDGQRTYCFTDDRQHPVSSLKKHEFMRLPGICRRLKRRRVTVVCNLEKFCWGRSWWRRQRTPPGQVCRCPRGSRCSHFFLHSI
uniref:Cocaine- and amphetamine-regulated transcript protein n=1 Tax=Fundulus heteroclitus TaxID=8078 RepID=A0A3Q2TH96_FUNHE